MFNSKETKSTESGISGTNQIMSGTTLTGDVICDGNIRIDGTLKGNLSAKGKVVIGASGMVDGEINCQNADISGTVKAKVTVSELLSLKASAKLSGDISTNKLAIEPGANFTGACSMGGIVKEFSKHGSANERSEAKEKTA
ncbi:MAG: polymer-forming cytoskeletal protein [Bacteroidia bacterium]